MAMLKIPRQYQTGISKLLKLNDKSIDELSSAIQQASPTLQPKDFTSRVASKVSSVDSKDIDQIIMTLVALYRVREERSLSMPDFAEEVCQAVERSDAKELSFSDKQHREFFRAHLIKLLSIEESLGVVSKAVGVLTEHERILIESRILTDIRSIFANPEQPPTAAVIVHMLRLEYIENAEFKEFFVALDTSDIRKLRDVLDRADKKAQSLKSVLGKTGLRYLDVE